jgi:hypothetical protein
MDFRSDVCFSNSGLDTIDEHTGIIKGVTIAREGVAKGHGVYLDSQFISDVARLGNEAEKGIKVRFGHPNMTSDALGTYLGRFKNFRVSEKKVYADLHMDEIAKKSPKGDLYSYVFGMARSNPDMFGNSIVFKAGNSRYEEELDENENVITKEYVSIVALTASDLVDTPAATDSFFSAMFANDSYSDYPEAAVKNAKRGIKLNEEVNNKCATDVGKQRAQQIAKKEGLSFSTIKRTFSYLSRAEEYYNPDDPEACGTISYLLWGGKPMKAWAERKINEIENNYKQKNQEMEKTFSERVLDVLSSVGIKFSTKEEVENTEVTVTPELETEVTATVEEEVVEETVAEDATTEEFSAEESQEAIAQAVEKFEEEREELVKEFSTKEADFTHALAELGEKVKSLQAELEAKQVELDALSVKPTTVEGSQDPSITGEEIKLSENQKVLQDFLKDIRG